MTEEKCVVCKDKSLSDGEVEGVCPSCVRQIVLDYLDLHNED